MKASVRLLVASTLLIILVSACSLLNPFAGTWKSGLLELDFKSDKTFKLVLGSAISINLDGKYTYDKETLTLDIDGDTEVIFKYSFEDGNKSLVLIPQSDFEYIKTKITLEKQ